MELIKAIENVIGHSVKVSFTPARSFDVPVNILDITRARKELLWSPEVGFEEGLLRTKACLIKHGDAE
jgi:UDP-glucose 4-epimerase